MPALPEETDAPLPRVAKLSLEEAVERSRKLGGRQAVRRCGLALIAALAGCGSAEPAPFLERFESGAVSQRWQVLRSGDASVQTADEAGGFACTSPAAGDACALRLVEPIDRTLSQLWVFALSAAGSALPQTWLQVIASAEAPDVGVDAGSTPEIAVRLAPARARAGLVFERREQDGAHTRWSTSRARWDAAHADAFAVEPAGRDDYSLVALEIDAETQRWRLLAWGRRSRAGYSFDQGLRLFAISDWTRWSDAARAAPLWLILGDRSRTSGGGTLRVAWARRDVGPAVHVWSNGRATAGHPYQIRHGWGRESAEGGVSFIVPRARDAAALAPGSAGSWDAGGVKDPYVVREAGAAQLHLLYAGTDGRRYQIGLAHADGPAADFARSGAAPLLGARPGTQEDQVFAPALVVDRREPDRARRYKLLYAATDPELRFRVFLATAPKIVGPWTRRGSVLGPGPAGSFDDGGYSRPRPFRAPVGGGEGWVVFAAASEGGRSRRAYPSYASGAALDALTPSGVVLVAPAAGASAAVSAAVAGTRVEVDDAAGFAADAFVEIDQHPSVNTYGQSRVRRVAPDGSLELYHGLDGFRAGPPTRIVAAPAARAIDVADAQRTAKGWNLYVTAFRFFDGHAGLGAFDENSGLLRGPALLGPYAWDALATPPWTRDDFGAHRSNENLSFLHEW